MKTSDYIFKQGVYSLKKRRDLEFSGNVFFVLHREKSGNSRGILFGLGERKLERKSFFYHFALIL